MLDAKRYLDIVRASALYDLVVTLPFLTPWSFGLVVALIAGVDSGLNLPGDALDPEMTTVLFANLMGAVVVVWSVARLHLGLAVLGRYDGVARLLFATWQINALLNGMSWAILPLLVVEIGFGVAQFLPARRA
jgi:hypothetical protein